MMENIGQTLRRTRLKAGLTRQQVADAIGVSMYVYHRVECGRHPFNLDWLARLPRTMRIPLAGEFHTTSRLMSQELEPQAEPIGFERGN
jgi:transcriptional regulator with XRE-family HTH domain